jgi:hypothetical protein
MRSPRGFYGAAALLLVLPVAIVCAIAFGDEETGLHLALATGAWLLAAAVFDYRVAGWLNRVTSITTATLGGIFFLQAVSPLTRSEALYDFSYNTLGQVIEGALTLWFAGWCVVMLFSDSAGKTRVLGMLTVVPLFTYVAASFVLKQGGSEGLPEALKLLFLPVITWLALESRKPAYFTLGLSDDANAIHGSSHDLRTSSDVTSCELTKTMPVMGRPVNSIS